MRVESGLEGQIRAGTEDDLSFANLSLDRAVVDLSRVDWSVQRDISSLSANQITALEIQLDGQLALQGKAHIHIGRGHFEIVQVEEAQLLRAERACDALREAESDLDVQRAQTNPSLDNCVIFSGMSDSALVKSITRRLGVSTGKLLLSKYANGETRVEVGESVRDREVFIIQSGAEPINDHVVELGLLAQALKLASVRSITAIPYYSYSRQDRKGDKRSPVSARTIADFYQNSGVDRVVTVDIHAKQIEGFFTCPMDNLAAFPLFAPYLAKEFGEKKIAFISPDAGGMERARQASEVFARFVEKFGIGVLPEISVAAMYKRRAAPGEVAESQLTGDANSIKGAICVLVDDLIDTGGSVIAAGKTLRQHDPEKVIVAATHPIFSRNAVERFRAESFDGNRLIDQVLVTDTLPLRRARGDLITVRSVADMLSEAITRIHAGKAASLRELSGFYGYEEH